MEIKLSVRKQYNGLGDDICYGETSTEANGEAILTDPVIKWYLKAALVAGHYLREVIIRIPL